MQVRPTARPAPTSINNGDERRCGLINDDAHQITGIGPSSTTHACASVHRALRWAGRQQAQYRISSYPESASKAKEVFHERLTLLGLLLRYGALHFGIAADVDPPAGEPRREPRVLSFATDRQGQLEIRDYHPGRTCEPVCDVHGDDL